MMRTVIYLLIFCVAATCHTRAADSTIYVRNESKNATVYVRKLNAFIKGSFPYTLSPGEESIIPLYTNRPTFIFFKILRNGRNYLVYPGDSVIVTDKSDAPVIKTNDARKDMQSAFLNQLHYQVEEMDNLKMKAISKSATLSERDAFFTDIYARTLQFINSQTDKYSLSETFISYCRKLAFSQMIVNKTEGQIHNYKFRNNLSQFYEKEFRSYVDSFGSDISNNILEYKKAALCVNAILAGTNDPVLQYKAVDKNFTNQDVRDFLKSKIVYDLLITNNIQYKKIVTDFYSTSHDKSAIASIKELENIKSNSVEVTANETLLVDVSGKKLTFSSVLQQNKGKIIYIDFWATWCAPCKKEMPYSHKLREQFAGQDVVFMYISADEDFKLWLAGVKDLKLDDLTSNYLFTDPYNNFLVRQLKINSYPRYVIFDRNGKLINTDAKRPSDAELKKQLQQLLP